VKGLVRPITSIARYKSQNIGQQGSKISQLIESIPFSVEIDATVNGRD
jgi:hypothetical protein